MEFNMTKDVAWKKSRVETCGKCEEQRGNSFVRRRRNEVYCEFDPSSSQSQIIRRTFHMQWLFFIFYFFRHPYHLFAPTFFWPTLFSFFIAYNYSVVLIFRSCI